MLPEAPPRAGDDAGRFLLLLLAPAGASQRQTTTKSSWQDSLRDAVWTLPPPLLPPAPMQSHGVPLCTQDLLSGLRPFALAAPESTLQLASHLQRVQMLTEARGKHGMRGHTRTGGAGSGLIHCSKLGEGWPFSTTGHQGRGARSAARKTRALFLCP